MPATAAESTTDLDDILKVGARRPVVRRSLFAWMCLGIVDQIRRGAITPQAAVVSFFHARNCLYVHRSLKNRMCDEVMGRGTQLADLQDNLPPTSAKRELISELSAIESLCRQIIDGD